MKNVLIGGIGNILLGDDGVGPYVVRLLESRYDFAKAVEVIDLGTPALDLVERIAGRDAVILIDCVDTHADAGTVLVYRKEEILRHSPGVHMDPHSPALVETLLAANFLGVAPADVLLVGVVAESFEAGDDLTPTVKSAVGQAIAHVLSELDRLGVSYKLRGRPLEPGIWWTSKQQTPVFDCGNVP